MTRNPAASGADSVLDTLLGQELIELDQYDAGQHYANLYGEVAKGASDTKIGRPFPRRVSLLADQKAVVEFLEARRLILMRRGSRIEKIVTDAAIFDEVPKDSDLSDLRVGLTDLFEYFRGTIKSAPRPADAWRPIINAIDRGQHPKPDEISAALCCPEPTIHADIRNYIARLLRGEIDRRGRPKKGNVKPKNELVERSMNFFEGNDVYQYFEASYLKRRVDRWHRVFRNRMHLSEPQNRAFEKVATEYGWRGGAAAARTRYYEAKEVLTTFALTVKIPDWRLRAMLGRHHVTARPPK